MKMRLTRILAVRSWPESSNWASSLFICFTCTSFLFFNNFNLEDASFKDILLHQIQKKRRKKSNQYEFSDIRVENKFRSINRCKKWRKDRNYHLVELKLLVSISLELLKKLDFFIEVENWKGKEEEESRIVAANSGWKLGYLIGRIDLG